MIYWCCPDCGYLFWQSHEASNGTGHSCPNNSPHAITIVNRPQEYKRGFIDGMRCHAHWKDGRQWVGTTGMTLKTAINSVKSMWNYNESK